MIPDTGGASLLAVRAVMFHQRARHDKTITGDRALLGWLTSTNCRRAKGKRRTSTGRLSHGAADRRRPLGAADPARATSERDVRRSGLIMPNHRIAERRHKSHR